MINNVMLQFYMNIWIIFNCFAALTISQLQQTTTATFSCGKING